MIYRPPPEVLAEVTAGTEPRIKTPQTLHTSATHARLQKMDYHRVVFPLPLPVIFTGYESLGVVCMCAKRDHRMIHIQFYVNGLACLSQTWA